MSSIIEGYNYDIFISYRQKDNKGDRWVSEFVEALKTELESTFKEEISVYFDINPHDGLLETHDVDDSLKEKLKCLIFIPIISRTYCDSKSFAWEHEFMPFVEQASNDQFGLKVKLANGNVASRVLPIRIHELDNADIKLCESVLGGGLRGIDFIYKEPGVDRPLMPKENEEKYLNKTKYRNQINKVALGIREIIIALGHFGSQDKVVSKEIFKPVSKPPKSHKTIIIAGSILALVLTLLGYLIISKLIKPSENLEKSIAVLPFKLISDEPDKQYLADGMMDAITLNLSKIKDLRVISRTSVEQYRNPTKTTTTIGRELDVNFLLEGSFQKFGDNARLIVQLIKTGKEGHIWANNYDRNWSDIFTVQSEVAQAVATELYASITQEEKKLINKIPTTDTAAYDFYLKANNYLKIYEKNRDSSFYKNAVAFFNAALVIDPSFAKAYTGLASAYYERYYYETYFKEGFMDSVLVLAIKALSIDDQLDEAYYFKGLYYVINGHITEALDNLDKALKINSNYYSAYELKGNTLTWVLNDFVKGIDNYNKALTLIQGDERTSLLDNLGRLYLDIGFIDKAKYYYREVLALDKDLASYLGKLAWIEYNLENFEEALRLEKRANEIDSTRLIGMEYYYYLPSVYCQEAYLNANKWVEYYKKQGALPLDYSYRIGYAFWQVGKKKEAEYYFNQQIKYSEERIKLGRLWSITSDYDLAATYAFLGEKVNAYQYLDEFYKNMGDKYSLWWTIQIEHDPFFSSIRSEERFQKIVKNIEAKYQTEHERVRKWLEEQGML